MQTAIEVAYQEASEALTVQILSEMGNAFEFPGYYNIVSESCALSLLGCMNLKLTILTSRLQDVRLQHVPILPYSRQ